MPDDRAARAAVLAVHACRSTSTRFFRTACTCMAAIRASHVPTQSSSAADASASVARRPAAPRLPRRRSISDARASVRVPAGFSWTISRPHPDRRAPPAFRQAAGGRPAGPLPCPSAPLEARPPPQPGAPRPAAPRRCQRGFAASWPYRWSTRARVRTIPRPRPAAIDSSCSRPRFAGRHRGRLRCAASGERHRRSSKQALGARVTSAPGERPSRFNHTLEAPDAGVVVRTCGHGVCPTLGGHLVLRRRLVNCTAR